MILENYKNEQYHAMLFAGSNKTPIKFRLDTGSNQSWFVNKPEYKSESLKVSENSKTINYFEGYTIGKLATESFSFYNIDQELQDIDIMSSSSYQKIDLMNSDGVLGLGPTSNEEGKKQLVTELKNQGIIDKAIYSLYLDDEAHQSKI